MNEEVAASDVDDLRELGIEIITKSTSYTSAREAVDHRAELLQHCRKAKLRHRAQHSLQRKLGRAAGLGIVAGLKASNGSPTSHPHAVVDGLGSF